MSWNPIFILLILFSTVVDYWCGRKMEGQVKNKRKPYLYLSILFNLGLLFTFKYFNFFSQSLHTLFEVLDLPIPIPITSILLPMGISFYTFQTMGYTVDVYNERIKPEKNFITFALYVSFFPQLVAGPIERAERLLPQFSIEKALILKNISSGFRLILWGFFKKVVIADRLSLFVDSVYNAPHGYDGTMYILATVFFAFQIYCDFSGYTDIAIGSARMLGFELMKNFKTPYFSQSIAEFWKRWHISLSTWFRDYLYIPLGGNRVIKWRWYYNLFITFVISGLWHGANWTFIIWGAIHGLFLIIETGTTSFRRRLLQQYKISRQSLGYRLASNMLVFALVCLSWIFFRANNLSDAWHIIAGSFDFNTTYVRDVLFQVRQAFYEPTSSLGPMNLEFGKIYLFISTADFILSFFFIALLVLIEYNYDKVVNSIKNLKMIPQILFYYCALMVILLFGIFSSQQFIYFQF